MQKFLNVLCLLMCALVANAGTIPFITTWQTNANGVTNANQISIPTFPNEIYDYNVDWGDGEVTNNITGNITHTYASAGSYQIRITGIFPRIYFNAEGDGQKIVSIDQWGNNEWLSMAHAFEGCSSLQGNYSDTPNLNSVSDMSAMFRLAQTFNYRVNDWDVSNVTNMSQLFENASSFNQPLNAWQVANVTDMSGMFNNFTEETIVITRTPIPGTEFFNQVRTINNIAPFNQDLGTWNVSRVTNMSNMFSATLFNQNLNLWDVSAVVNMSGMFSYARNFNQNLNNWNVGNVTNMSLLFADAEDFNQDISNWEVGQVTQMQQMFEYAGSFNQDLNTWDTSMVTDMGFMFGNATTFNGEIGNWNTQNVINMRGLFINTANFNQDIGNWDTGMVLDMSGMFFGNGVFNQNLNAWDVGNVIEFFAMFAYAEAYNSPLNNWDMANAELMNFMFFQAFDFDQNLGSWNVSKLTDATAMFSGVKLSVENYDSLLINWEEEIVIGNVPFDGGLSQYCAGAAARDRLIGADNWSIMDGGAVSFQFNAINNQTHEYVFVFPEITGSNLTGNEAYYTAANGTGQKYVSGDELVYNEATTYPLAIYRYDATTASNICSIQDEFQLTLTQCGENFVPQLAIVSSQTRDHIFSLPVIQGSNLSGNEAYYTVANGNGTSYPAGEQFFYEDFESYPVTFYIYDEKNASYGYSCTAEISFDLTITETLPGCTILIEPFDQATDVNLDLAQIRWDEVYNARAYEVSIGTTTNTSDLLNSVITDEAFILLSEPLPEATEIYVNIVPYNSIGKALGCALHSFRTETNIQIPAFFTPNGDGINDVWVLPNPFDSLVSASVFDRFGRLLYQANKSDLNRSWDGTYANTPLPSNSYWYVVEYTTGEIFKGSLVLKR